MKEGGLVFWIMNQQIAVSRQLFPHPISSLYWWTEWSDFTSMFLMGIKSYNALKLTNHAYCNCKWVVVDELMDWLLVILRHIFLLSVFSVGFLSTPPHSVIIPSFTVGTNLNKCIWKVCSLYSPYWF